MPESEDEYILINDVDILCLSLKQAEIPFDAEKNKTISTRICASEDMEVGI
jgi:hypothetical protein